MDMSVTEVIDEEWNAGFQLYPNPTNGVVTLRLPAKVEGSLRGISVADVQGVRLFDEQSNPAFLSGSDKTIDLTDKAHGLYFITITSDKIYHLKILRK
jgi:hypothetical protein